MRVGTILDKMTCSTTTIASITPFLLARRVVVSISLLIPLFLRLLLGVLLGIPGFLHHSFDWSWLFHQLWVCSLGSFGSYSSCFLVVFLFSFHSSGSCKDFFIRSLCSIQVAQGFLVGLLQALIESVPQATLYSGLCQLSWMVSGCC